MIEMSKKICKYRGSSNSADSDSAVSIQCDILFGPKGARFYSIICAIPCNSVVFGSHTSIDSNSAVLDSAQNFWDKFPRYSRTPCMCYSNVIAKSLQLLQSKNK